MLPVRTVVGVLAGVLGLLLVLVLLGTPLPLYRYEPTDWSDPEVLDGGRTLRVTVMHGACDEGSTVRVRLHADEIEVRAYVKEHRLPDDPVWDWRGAGCIALGVFQCLDIPLPEPLAGRTAYDPFTGQREQPGEQPSPSCGGG